MCIESRMLAFSRARPHACPSYCALHPLIIHSLPRFSWIRRQRHACFLTPCLAPCPSSLQLSFSDSASDDEDSVEDIWATGPLAHDSPAPEVEAALEALTGIDDVAVDVELLHGGHGGRIFSVVWPVGASSRNVPQLRVNGSGLTPAGSEEEAAAIAFVNEVHHH